MRSIFSSDIICIEWVNCFRFYSRETSTKFVVPILTGLVILFVYYFSKRKRFEFSNEPKVYVALVVLITLSVGTLHFLSTFNLLFHQTSVPVFALGGYLNYISICDSGGCVASVDLYTGDGVKGGTCLPKR